MTRSTEDALPELTKIGDGQFHHFRIDVPEDRRNVTLKVAVVDDSVNAELRFYLSRGSVGRAGKWIHESAADGEEQVLRTRLESGPWYVGVECATRVHAIEDSESGFYRYIGDRSILNGVPYSILVLMDE